MENIEVKTLVDKVNEGIVALQSELSAVKGDVARNGELNDKLDKMAEQVTKSAEALQLVNQKQAAMEAAMNRIDVAGDKRKASPEVVTKSKALFREFARTGEVPSDSGFKMVRDGNKVGFEVRGMSTDNNPNGGYLVLPEMADFMVTRVFETTPMRSLARVITIGSKSIEVIINDNQVGSGWIDEGGTISETSTPEFGKLQIVAHKLYAEPMLTTEQLEDSFFDVEGEIAKVVSENLSRDQNSAFVSGNGIGKPKGFTTFSNWTTAGTYERGKIEQIALGGASDVTADGLISLQAALKEEYQVNATWLMKRASYGNVLKLKGSDNYFFSTSLLRDGQTQLTLLGRPVVFADDMAAIASNALSVAYGDFSRAYTIVDRVGIQTLRDAYTAKGYVKFFTTVRVGGAVTSYDALKLGKVATSV